MVEYCSGVGIVEELFVLFKTTPLEIVYSTRLSVSLSHTLLPTVVTVY